MTTPSLIITAVKNQLSNDTNLSGVGIRLGFSEAELSYPVVIIEPSDNAEADDIYKNQECTLSLFICGLIQSFDEDNQIVGTSLDPGILDFENNVKKALSKDRRFATSGIVDSSITATSYTMENYPVRAFVMTLKIIFRQNLENRT